MKTSAIFSSIVALLGVSPVAVNAGCFGGELWQNPENARWHIDRACRGYDGKQGAFQGYFNPGQAKSVCVTVSSTQRINLFVQNLNTAQGFDLADSDCAFRLGDIVRGCPRGGDATIAGWKFRADPNLGVC
ncbi:hypothetical protein QBC42DRAFT_305195 [Cladorrhinum samala]|uniref:Secreted protein n=1 Tax=Cladorrhinum samala TaxID=585594 RepID=A0AAV9HQD9_9PEZI|nr:hypothetical protein QBC42DRAFT_305195 [Cladorrhinum samala]